MEYTDNGISASKRDVKRSAYAEMVAEFSEDRFGTMICYDLDRLTRQPAQLEDWIAATEVTGLMIVTANGEAGLSTDNGRLFTRIKASVARAETERMGARQRRANEQRIANGFPTPGRRRYGYESDGVTIREADIVRRLFALNSSTQERLAYRIRHSGKQRPACRQVLPLSAFGRDLTRPDGLRYKCHKCVTSQTKASRASRAQDAKV